MTTTVLTPGNFAISKKESKKALLVIDVQENLLDPRSRVHIDPTAVFSFTNILNKTIEFFQANQLPVLYIVNEWRNPVLNVLTGNVCKKGAKGTGIAKKVNIVNEKIYSKSKMNALSNKQLCLFLKENGISELYITGLFAEACIKSTAIAAIKNNYQTTIIEDAVGSRNVKRKLVALLYCERKGATIVGAQKLLNQFALKSSLIDVHPGSSLRSYVGGDTLG